ncbi:hypothetical protein FRC12_003280 [Ceratobasidium sp. 428]|nr:hypothetical protein FRC12_003280 [Ceratobasidium sp. 428]
MSGCLIDGLPSEILSQIFVILNGASLYARSICDTSYGPIDYPTLLSHICSRWRHIALSTPYLWSYIDYTTAGNTLQRLGRVNRYLHRSHNAPLRVRFGTYNDGCVRQDIEPRVESLLRSGAPRLESLAISYYHSSFAKQTLSTVASGSVTTPLTTLALLAHSGDKRIIADSEDLSQDDLNRLLEPLQNLYMDSVSPDWNHLACRNLVELHLLDLPMNGIPNAQQLVSLLKVNPTLRSIRLWRFLHNFVPPEPVLQSIRLPDLEHLDLNMDPRFVDWFISILIPGSHDLEISLASWAVSNRPNITNTFLALCNRARITSLHISGDWISLSHFYDYLPYLRTLRLSSQMLLESTLAGLHEAAHPFPQLETLEIIACARGGGGFNWLRTICAIRSFGMIKFRHLELYLSGRKMKPEEIIELFTEGCGSCKVQVVHSLELDLLSYPSPF